MLYKPESWLEWSYVAVVVTQALVSLSLEGALYQIFQSQFADTPHYSRNNAATTVPTLLSVLIFAWLYLLVLLYDTLATKNIYQIMALPVYSLVVIVVLIIQVNQVHDAVQKMMEGFDSSEYLGVTDELLISAGVVPAVLIIPQIYLTMSFRKVFGGVILKLLDADLRLRDDLRWVESCFALLKLDFFFLPVSAISLSIILGGQNLIQRYITIAILPLIVIGLCCAFYLVRCESKMGTFVILLGIISYMVGLIYKIVTMYDPSFSSPYLALRKVLTFLATMSLLACMLTFVTLCRCMSAYGKGLKPYLTMWKDAYEYELQHDLSLSTRRLARLPDWRIGAPSEHSSVIFADPPSGRAE